MKINKGAMALILVAITAAMVMGQGYRPDSSMTDETFKTFARRNTNAKTIVSDGIPLWCVVFDDSRDGTSGQIREFLREGIPVDLSIHADMVDGASRLTWQEIRDLMAFASTQGTILTISNHSNGGFTGMQAGDYARIVDQLKNDEIIAELGVEPTIFRLPGDVSSKAFAFRNRLGLYSVLDSLGYKYAGLAAGGNDDSTGVLNAFSRLFELDGVFNLGAEQGIPASGMGKPGLNKDPYWFPMGVGIDLGQMVTERGLGETSASVFTIVGEGGTPRVNQYTNTWQWLYSAALANNLGMAVVMHDSVDTDANTIDIDDGSGAVVHVGHFSPSKVADTLKKLWDAGHVRMVTLEEHLDWMFGDYAIGVNLIDNPSCLIPQFDIGDTLGGQSQYAYVRGLGNAGVTRNAFDATLVDTRAQVTDFDEETSGNNLAQYDNAGNHPKDFIGNSVVGYKDRLGGMLFPAAGANPRNINFVFGGLQPGRYQFGFAIKETGAGGNMILNELHFATAMRAQNIEASLENMGSTVYADTVLHWKWQDTDEQMNITGPDDEWYTMPFDFYLPAQLDGDVMTGSIWGDETARSNANSPNLFAAGEIGQRMWIEDLQWMVGFRMDFFGEIVLSHPTLRYLGPSH